MAIVDIYAISTHHANEWIPSPISKYSPVLAYDMSLNEYLLLRHYANIAIYPTGTKKMITMDNIKESFPEYDDGSSSSGSGQSSSGSGTFDYNELTNKPKINGVTLTGNKTIAEIGIVNLTDEQLDNLLKLS